MFIAPQKAFYIRRRHAPNQRAQNCVFRNSNPARMAERNTPPKSQTQRYFCRWDNRNGRKSPHQPTKNTIFCIFELPETIIFDFSRLKTYENHGHENGKHNPLFVCVARTNCRFLKNSIFQCYKHRTKSHKQYRNAQEHSIFVMREIRI